MDTRRNFATLLSGISLTSQPMNLERASRWMVCEVNWATIFLVEFKNVRTGATTVLVLSYGGHVDCFRVGVFFFSLRSYTVSES